MTNNINSIISGKSGGLDGMLIEMLRTTALMICPVLKKLSNKIMDHGKFPESWGKKYLCPIFKKGDVNDPNNYRGISLIDVLNKIFAEILNDKIYKYCTENNTLEEAQACLRKCYSKIDNIFTIESMVQKYLSGRFYCLLFILSKAFDTVEYQKILTSLNVKRHRWETVKKKSMFQALKSCVRYIQTFTDFFDCNIGTRQGYKLSHLL